jgi:hypothetical protein
MNLIAVSSRRAAKYLPQGVCSIAIRPHILKAPPFVIPTGHEAGLQMCKKPLREKAMSTAEVFQAKDWASRLIKLESRGPGDTDNAMRRIARRHGIEYGAIWSLRYRSPKRVWADVYTALRAAYEAECARQMEAMRHEIEITKRITGADHAAVAAAAAVVGSAEGEASR